MAETPTIMNLGRTLKALRVAHGLSQKEAAEALDVTPSYLSQVEGGRRPGRRFLTRVSDLFGIPLHLLVAREGEANAALYDELRRALSDVLTAHLIAGQEE
ncbi:MAG: helix-turn-helix transcriptional regulator [Candidatus Brocadiia bacterium]